MRARRSAALLAALAAGIAATTAVAAPPGNDSPQGATEFETFTAPNGTPVERQAGANLAEAGPDAGVPRCLGAASFARTVWYRVPAAQTPTLVRVEGTGPEGDGVEVPDLAAFVQPAGAAPGSPSVTEPQACDGPAAGGGAEAADPAAAVELRVPAGRTVLIQAGRSEGQRSTQIQLTARVEPLGAVATPAGDAATAAPTIGLGARATVALGGATLTEEDPAQPACPAAGTVWRKAVARATGRHTARAEGPAVGALTVFVGPRPTGDNAVVCDSRASSTGPLNTRFDARRGQAIWLRAGTDSVANGATGILSVTGPRAAAGRRCVSRRGGVRRVNVGAARLGRKRAAQRRTLRPATRFRRARRGYDRYCVQGGGQIRIGYPTRFLNARIGAQQRRRTQGRAVLLLATSKRLQVRGVRVGSRSRAVRRRLRGERRVRVSGATYFLVRRQRATMVFRTSGGRVRELGLADKRLTRNRRAAKRVFRSFGRR